MYLKVGAFNHQGGVRADNEAVSPGPKLPLHRQVEACLGKSNGASVATAASHVLDTTHTGI